MLETIHAGKTASISEFKKNPQALIDAAHGESIALLNRNKTTAYIVSPEIYERLLEIAEDIELGKIFEERKHEMDDAIEINIDEL
ncbi:MAG: type II toxin-antitoxin system Phd/YefM family antitoxin [Deltaproteobacteria bacterium]|nr:type II toxin-antitoxin system Phd/YefM family antitoxin [Deltaproteobacteria bacterium]